VDPDLELRGEGEGGGCLPCRLFFLLDQYSSTVR